MAIPLPVSEQQDQTVERVRTAIQGLLDRGAKVTDLAKKIGYSHTSLSMFMNGKYASPEVIARTAEPILVNMGVLEPLISQPKTLNRDSIVYTTDFITVFSVCQKVWEEREIGVVIAPAGAGKTTALKEYCKKNPDSTSYIRADVSLSTAELLVELGQTVGLQYTNGISLRSMVRGIVQRLQAQPRLIIVDEADLLLSGTVRKMEILRTIFDEAGNSGLLLCGMPRLKPLLVKGPSLKENLAQFYSRVAYMKALGGLTSEDLDMLLEGYRVTDAARRELVQRAKDNGHLRRLMKVLRKAEQLRALEGSEAITQTHVREADGLGLNL